MSRTVYEGNTEVFFATTVANIQAPTVAEITAAVELTAYITKDGVAVPGTQNMVDAAGLNETFDAQRVGSWGGGALTLTMFRDDTDETDSYDLIEYGLEGFIIISRFGDPVATSKVEVWPVEAHEPTLMNTAKNEMQKFSAAFAVTAAPAMRAVVAP